MIYLDPDPGMGNRVSLPLTGDDRVADYISAGYVFSHGRVYMGQVQLHGLRPRKLRKQMTPELEAEYRFLLEEELRKFIVVRTPVDREKP